MIKIIRQIFEHYHRNRNPCSRITPSTSFFYLYLDRSKKANKCSKNWSEQGSFKISIFRLKKAVALMFLYVTKDTSKIIQKKFDKPRTLISKVGKMDIFRISRVIFFPKMHKKTIFEDILCRKQVKFHSSKTYLLLNFLRGVRIS